MRLLADTSGGPGTAARRTRGPARKSGDGRSTSRVGQRRSVNVLRSCQWRESARVATSQFASLPTSWAYKVSLFCRCELVAITHRNLSSAMQISSPSCRGGERVRYITAKASRWAKSCGNYTAGSAAGKTLGSRTGSAKEYALHAGPWWLTVVSLAERSVALGRWG
jgi:hypothetical protein